MLAGNLTTHLIDQLTDTKQELMVIQMRQLFTILFTTLFCSTTFGQIDRVGVYVPSDDGSVVTWEIKHMWVGEKNKIGSVGDLLKVSTDNGIVDNQIYSGLTYYSIIPAKSGKLTVYTTQIYNDDTITTETTFTAIVPPAIKIQITDDSFKKDSTIKFVLVDKLTNKEVANRYVVGRMFEPTIYNSQDSLIGDIVACNGTTIEKLNFKISKLKIEKDYKMKFKLLVRDLETDLLVWTDETTYTFE